MAARRLTTLLAAFAVLAFVMLAYGTACDPVPSACCTSLEHGDAFSGPDLASPGTSGKALAGPPAVAYFFAGAATLIGVALLSTSAAQRPRSFYARSTRILR